jgi:hypothetical protein
MLREITWTSTDPAPRTAVTAQLDRLTGTITRQDFDRPEQERLREQAQQVGDALAGRWTG